MKEVVRTSLRRYLNDWFDGKKAETAPSTMTFYRSSLSKFLQFSAGQERFDDRIGILHLKTAIAVLKDQKFEYPTP